MHRPLELQLGSQAARRPPRVATRAEQGQGAAGPLRPFLVPALPAEDGAGSVTRLRLRRSGAAHSLAADGEGLGARHGQQQQQKGAKHLP